MALSKEDLENVAVVAAKTMHELLRNPPPPRSPLLVQNEYMRFQRGSDAPLPPTHSTPFTCTITDPSTASPVHVSGLCSFQQIRSSLPGPDGGGRGPLVWKLMEIPEDNFADEGGDLRRLHDGDFSQKNRDDIQRAHENPEVASDLRARHSKSWRVCVFTRGRRPLHTLLLGKTSEQVAALATLADPPPAIGSAVATTEAPPSPPPEQQPDLLRAILHGA